MLEPDEFESACRVMHGKFGDAAALCASPVSLLHALGLVGDDVERLPDGIDVSAAAEGFRVAMPDGTTPPSIVELLFRLERDDLRDVARWTGDSPFPMHNHWSRRDSAPLEDDPPTRAPSPLPPSPGRKESHFCSLFPHADSGDEALPPIVGGRDSGRSRTLSEEVVGERSSLGESTFKLLQQ